MKTTLALGVAATMAALTSCTSVKSISPEALTGEWDIVKLEGNKVTPTDGDIAPYLAFDVVNGRFFGYGGCNYMMGSFFTGEGNEIQLSTEGVTMMMCPDIAFQDSLIQALTDIRQYDITKQGELQLSSGSDRTLIALTKRPDTISPALLAGEWKVTLLGDYDLEADSTDTYTISFFPEDSTFSMTTGCNNVGGNYSGTFIDIRFTDMRSTRMACPDMSVEQAAQAILPSVTSFNSLGDNYGFYDAGNNLVMMIAPAKD